MMEIILTVIMAVITAFLGGILGTLLLINRQLGGIKVLLTCTIGSLNEARLKLGLAPFHGTLEG